MRKRKGGRTVQRERRIYHGNYLDVHVFPVFRKAGKRCKRYRESSDAQKKLNQKYRENKVTYLINQNFTNKDIEAGLGYDDKNLPATYDECHRDVVNFHRRVNRLRKALDLSPLKYLYSIQRGEKNGRLHIHDLMSGGKVDTTDETIKKIKRFFPKLTAKELRDQIERGGYLRLIELLWGKGYAYTHDIVYDDEGFKGLAHYKIREPQTEKEIVEGKIRRWAASKNLKPPKIPKDRDGFISRRTTKDIREGNVTEREIERLYPGYTVTTIEPLFNNINAGEYLTIRLRRTETSRTTKEVFKSVKRKE